MEHYKREGYNVFRCAGSHSKADVICIPPKFGLRLAIVVQCKKYSKTKPKPEKEFIEWDINAIKFWATKKKGQKGFNREYIR